MKRVDVFALAILGVLAAGLAVTARTNADDRKARASSTNNLKQIALGFHNHNDAYNCLPHNGGANDAETLMKVNYGWHNPGVPFSGTWATQILPFMEQDLLYRNIVIEGVAPPDLPKYPNDKVWQVSVMTYLCPGRDRAGFKTSREKGSYPGPLTDYALNVFLNSTPQMHNKDGYAIGNVPDHGGDWAAKQNKQGIQHIADGSSNTIMVAGKALPPAAKAAPKNCGEEDDACAPVPAAADADVAGGDEGIFSPGNWKLDGKEKKLVSTGTGRGHVVVKDPPKEPKENPKDGGVPWIYQDSELAGKEPPTQWSTAWGGPFEAGLIVAWCDGSVRILKYSQRGTVNFARMLYPADGAVVNFD